MKKKFRIYPQKNLFSHILGQTDDSNTGISGIEKFFDKDLKSRNLINSSLVLTLDSNLQYLIRKELISAGIEIIGMSDHTVSQSIYVSDPDSNEVELYVDDNSVNWKDEPDLVMSPIKPLNLNN